MGNCTPSFLLKVGLAMGVGIFLRFPALAQCTNNLATRSYDTALTSNGFGIYAMSVPQFSPDSGLLVSVKLSATTTSQYGFTLKNADTANAIYALTLGQEDQFSGAALGSPFTNVMSQFINTYPLTPGQQVVTPPFQFLNGHISSDSITTNTAPFLGTGNVDLNYMSFTYTSLTTTNNSTYYYYSNTTANNLHFTVQYLYCQADIALPATLTRFSAVLTSPHTAQLSWAAVNETAGRSYDVQRSSNDRDFTTVGSMPAQGDESGADYSYADTLPGNGIGNWYYRLQVHGQGGLSWSPVKEVTVPGSGILPIGAGVQRISESCYRPYYRKHRWSRRRLAGRSSYGKRGTHTAHEFYPIGSFVHLFSDASGGGNLFYTPSKCAHGKELYCTDNINYRKLSAYTKENELLGRKEVNLAFKGLIYTANGDNLSQN